MSIIKYLIILIFFTILDTSCDAAKNFENKTVIATISGEKLDIKKHNFKVEIKSPTFHLMEIEENDEITMRYLLDL